MEQNLKIPFLDLLLMRTPQNIYATVYCKKTNINLCKHWNSFALDNWK